MVPVGPGNATVSLWGEKLGDAESGAAAGEGVTNRGAVFHVEKAVGRVEALGDKEARVGAEGDEYDDAGRDGAG